MEKQVIDFGMVVRAFNAYASAGDMIERAQNIKMESRKAIVEFIRAHAGKENWTSELNAQVKADIDAMPPGICTDKTGLLGVIKTCCEYSIMPTTVNANRLRKKHKTWTDLNGKSVPNTYEKKHKDKPTASTTPATPATPLNALALATMQPGAATPATPTPTPTPASKASTKPTTPQKSETPTHPLNSNVSSPDAPISAREHFGILFTQMLKNETFRGEYTEILAMMLDIDKATLTRCMVQARDEIK